MVLVVGSCAEGYVPERNIHADLLYTLGDAQEDMQVCRCVCVCVCWLTVCVCACIMSVHTYVHALRACTRACVTSVQKRVCMHYVRVHALRACAHVRAYAHALRACMHYVRALRVCTWCLLALRARITCLHYVRACCMHDVRAHVGGCWETKDEQERHCLQVLSAVRLGILHLISGH